MKKLPIMDTTKIHPDYFEFFDEERKNVWEEYKKYVIYDVTQIFRRDYNLVGFDLYTYGPLNMLEAKNYEQMLLTEFNNKVYEEILADSTMRYELRIIVLCEKIASNVEAVMKEANIGFVRAWEYILTYFHLSRKEYIEIISLLVSVWKYKKELHAWSNKQEGYESNTYMVFSN